MLRMEQTTLAEKAGVSVDTVKRLEGVDGPPKAQPGTLQAIREVLELGGLDLDGGGVRRATDRDARVREALAAEIGSFVRSGLELQTKRDASLFDRGSAHVTERLIKLLSPALLAKMVERVLPNKPPRKPSRKVE